MAIDLMEMLAQVGGVEQHRPRRLSIASEAVIVTGGVAAAIAAVEIATADSASAYEVVDRTDDQVVVRWEKGDTVIKTAKELGSTPALIDAVNDDVTNPDEIVAGETDVVPVAKSEEQARTLVQPTSHVIEHGDSLWKIAEHNYPGHNTGEIVDMLASANGLEIVVKDGREFVKLHPGQRLKLPILGAQALSTHDAQPTAVVKLKQGGGAWKVAERVVAVTPENDSVSEVADRIVAANDKAPEKYQVGESIVVPGVSQEILHVAMQTSGAPAVAEAPTHTAQVTQAAVVRKEVPIQAGDNLIKIASAEGTTVDKIQASNPDITDPDKIIAGETLVIEEEVAAAPVPAPPVPAETAPAAPVVEQPSVVAAAEAAPQVEAQRPISEMFTLDVVQRMLPGASPQTIAERTPIVLDALKEFQIEDLGFYVFATFNAENASFIPRHEKGGNAYFTRMYEGREDLGNTEPGDGVKFHGRGDIQVTGKHNNTVIGGALGIDLVNNPDLALDSRNSARIAAYYIQQRADPIRAALADNDMVRARKIVNGGTNGLEPFTQSYVAGQQAYAEKQTQRQKEEAEKQQKAAEEAAAKVAAEEQAKAEKEAADKAAAEAKAAEEAIVKAVEEAAKTAEETRPKLFDQDVEASEAPSRPETAPVAEEIAPPAQAEPEHSIAGETMIHPVGEQYRVSSEFGPRKAPKTNMGAGSSVHNGTDFATPVGTPLMAPQDGEVVFAGEKGKNGNLVVIDLGKDGQDRDVTMAVAHLDSIDVKVGDDVEQGEVVAKTGNTGNSSGPHAHVTVRVGGEPIDPRPLFEGRQGF